MTCACGAKKLCTPCKGVALLTEAYERHHKLNLASDKEASAYLRKFSKEHPELASVAARALELF